MQCFESYVVCAFLLVCGCMNVSLLIQDVDGWETVFLIVDINRVQAFVFVSVFH